MLSRTLQLKIIPFNATFVSIAGNKFILVNELNVKNKAFWQKKSKVREWFSQSTRWFVAFCSRDSRSLQKLSLLTFPRGNSDGFSLFHNPTPNIYVGCPRNIGGIVLEIALIRAMRSKSLCEHETSQTTTRMKSKPMFLLMSLVGTVSFW